MTTIAAFTAMMIAIGLPSSTPSLPTSDAFYPPPASNDGRIVLKVHCSAKGRGDDHFYECEMEEFSLQRGATPTDRDKTTARMADDLMKIADEEKKKGNPLATDCSKPIGADPGRFAQFPEIRHSMQATNDAFRTFCVAPTRDHAQAVAMTMFDAQAMSCSFVRHRSIVEFRYDVANDGWTGNATPFGACGVVDSYRFEKGKDAYAQWNLEDTRVVTRASAPECRATPEQSERAEHFDWRWIDTGFIFPDHCIVGAFHDEP
jgi:hypothetical protein